MERREPNGYLNGVIKNGFFYKFSNNLNFFNYKFLINLLRHNTLAGGFIGDVNNFISFNRNGEAYLYFNSINTALKIINEICKAVTEGCDRFFKFMCEFKKLFDSGLDFAKQISDDFLVEIKVSSNSVERFIFIGKDIIIDNILLKVICFDCNLYLDILNRDIYKYSSDNNQYSILYYLPLDEIDNLFNIINKVNKIKVGNIYITCLTDGHINNIFNKCKNFSTDLNLNSMNYLIANNLMEYFLKEYRGIPLVTTMYYTKDIYLNIMSSTVLLSSLFFSKLVDIPNGIWLRKLMSCVKKVYLNNYFSFDDNIRDDSYIKIRISGNNGITVSKAGNFSKGIEVDICGISKCDWTSLSYFSNKLGKFFLESNIKFYLSY